MIKNTNPKLAPNIVPIPLFNPVLIELEKVSCRHITAVRHAKNGSLGHNNKHRNTAIPDLIVLRPTLGNCCNLIVLSPVKIIL